MSEVITITITVDEITITAPASAITVMGMPLEPKQDSKKQDKALAIKKLAKGTHNRFMEYYDDASEWGGSPLVGGNVGGDRADKGFIVNMKKAGLVNTSVDHEDRTVWITFTAKAHEYFMQFPEEHRLGSYTCARELQKDVFGYEPSV